MNGSHSSKLQEHKPNSCLKEYKYTIVTLCFNHGVTILGLYVFWERRFVLLEFRIAVASLHHLRELFLKHLRENQYRCSSCII